MLPPGQVTGTLHAYQLAKRGNSLRVMAEAVQWAKRGTLKCMTERAERPARPAARQPIGRKSQIAANARPPAPSCTG